MVKKGPWLQSQPYPVVKLRRRGSDRASLNNPACWTPPNLYLSFFKASSWPVAILLKVSLVTTCWIGSPICTMTWVTETMMRSDFIKSLSGGGNG